MYSTDNALGLEPEMRSFIQRKTEEVYRTHSLEKKQREEAQSSSRKRVLTGLAIGLGVVGLAGVAYYAVKR